MHENEEISEKITKVLSPFHKIGWTKNIGLTGGRNIWPGVAVGGREEDKC